jgi:hypothetical protein
MFVLAKEIGLTAEERLELASTLLWRDITTWKDLDEAQTRRILDALEGYEKISALLQLRP